MPAGGVPPLFSSKGNNFTINGDTLVFIRNLKNLLAQLDGRDYKISCERNYNINILEVYFVE